MNLSHYFICFMIYSFFGWIYESLFYTFQFKKPVNTGFLKGCICPIYGLACVANMIMFRNVTNSLTMFVVSMIVISAIEYFVSWLLENLFEKRWWDYSNWPLNINGRISLISSLAFGLLSVVQMKLINPSVVAFVVGIPDRTVHILVMGMALFVALDLLVTVKSMGKSDDKLWFVETQSPVLNRANEKLEETKNTFFEHYGNIIDKIRDFIGS